jgi:hypothetical protein
MKASAFIIVIVLMLTTMMAGCINYQESQPSANQVTTTPAPGLVAEQKMGVTISPQNPVTEIGSAIRFVAVYDNGYSPNDVKWSVAGPATIDSQGRFQATGLGSATVTATVGSAAIKTNVDISGVVYRYYSEYNRRYCYRGYCHSYSRYESDNDYYYDDHYDDHSVNPYRNCHAGAVKCGVDEAERVFGI